MKRILIYGLKDPIGGVENLILSYVSRFPCERIVCDYVVFGSPFSREAEITARGGRVYVLPNRIRRPLQYRKALRTVFENERYDAVWANFAGLTNLDVLRVGKRYGVPIRIAHSHGTRLYWTGRLMRVLVPLFHTVNKPKVKRYATHFWACSQPAGRFLFPPAVWERVSVLPNAVDTAVFSPSAEKRQEMRRSLGLDNAPVVGHIARLSAEKNQLFLLEAFQALYQRCKDARLLLVGDGECRELLEDAAQRLGIADAVIFTGFQTDTAAYYRACDVFVLPSLSEGLGLSLIEAQACGVPCIASTAVPKEADVTDTVRFLDLQEPISVWADAMEQAIGQAVPNAAAAIRNAGYDLSCEADKLLEFFEG